MNVYVFLVGQAKLAWYAENQELVTKSDLLVSEQQKTITALEARVIEQGVAGGGVMKRQIRSSVASFKGSRVFISFDMVQTLYKVLFQGVWRKIGERQGCIASLHLFGRHKTLPRVLNAQSKYLEHHGLSECEHTDEQTEYPSLKLKQMQCVMVGEWTFI